MNKSIIALALSLSLSLASAAVALDNSKLVGTWQLVENAKDADGNNSPFVTEKLQFTSDGKMISANMPMPFRYKVNPDKAEIDRALARFPDLKGMEIMLAMVGNSPNDWSRPNIVYGVELKDNKFTMKLSGYTPARYKKLK